MKSMMIPRDRFNAKGDNFNRLSSELPAATADKFRKRMSVRVPAGGLAEFDEELKQQ